jgi:uncharacterized protein YukJ
MPLPAYGLLVGKITGSRPTNPGHAHWLLMVQPDAPGHPPYRVAVNLEAAGRQDLESQVIAVEADGSPALKALVTELRRRGATLSFLTGPGLPALDFVRGGLIDPADFPSAPAGETPETAFEATLGEAMETKGALLAVFGSGYPIKAGSHGSPSTGYTGVENIHMNQGTLNKTGSPAPYRENGPDQDGGLIFLLPDRAMAFFVKFKSQSVETDRNGNPLTTGIAEIDAAVPQVKALLAAHPAVTAALEEAKAVAATPFETETPAGFVFADPGPDDITGHFMVDDDAGVSQTPFVMTYAKGQTRGPVPNPRGYPTLKLSDVVGAAVPGYSKSPNGDETIAFDLIGDSGATTQAKLKGETSVGDLMTAGAHASPPAFLYHVGDVVYFYGEKQFYYGQFADVFKDYPAPIFAIPGNHDGIIHEASMVSLESFQAAFCAAAPGRWDGFGGILRSTMTQPGVFFTLDAPLVSIVGLYSNCGESLGWLDPQQYAFLQTELARLKALRDAGEARAVILAVHHFPRWFPTATSKDPMSVQLDAICDAAGLWPDAVVAGHAHLYQRIVRQTVAGRDIPYFVNGGGGYGIMALEQLGKPYLRSAAPPPNATLFEEGYLRATVSKTGGKATLAFAYNGVKHATANPVDTCTIDLGTHKMA